MTDLIKRVTEFEKTGIIYLCNDCKEPTDAETILRNHCICDDCVDKRLESIKKGKRIFLVIDPDALRAIEE